MSRRDDTVPMRHMLDHAREILAMVQGRTPLDLNTDRMFQLALMHLITLIGEAANRVTGDGRARYPEVPAGGLLADRRTRAGAARASGLMGEPR
jgi:uncharacterized protein with HEPN domain